ncbi:AAA family ATPase [Kitasatospora purpeofusca]|uniref:AAA family ATPase n=1 Tax=Kitasatospora purpeofusca TaxID=67352 RepID=UPI003827CC18
MQLYASGTLARVQLHLPGEGRRAGARHTGHPGLSTCLRGSVASRSSDTDSPAGVGSYLRPRPRPTLVVVSGPPGSGKSTTARRIADRACLPVISRDALKGGICFTHGQVPADIAALTAERFRTTLVELATAGVSLVAEWALHRATARELLPLLGGVAELRLVQCTAPREVLLDRVRARLADDPGTRWPFPDERVLADLADGSFPLAEFTPADAAPATLVVDTSGPGEVDLDPILRFCFAADRPVADGPTADGPTEGRS